MPGEGLKGYMNMLMPSRENGAEAKKSGSFVGFLTKTVLFGGIVAASYYLGQDSTKSKGVVSKILMRPRENKTKITECILHCKDNCLDCIRVELVLAFLGVPYTRKLSKSSEKAQLPLLEYKQSGMKKTNWRNIIYSLDSDTTHRSIPLETKRLDLDKWLKDSSNTRQDLIRLKDQLDIDEDAGWFKNRKTNPQPAKMIEWMNTWLEEFDNVLLYDTRSVNKFGFGMDDILVIPELRALTCIKGLVWPDKLRSYLKNAFEDVVAELFFGHEVELVDKTKKEH